jgi:hypothetical protein
MIRYKKAPVEKVKLPKHAEKHKCNDQISLKGTRLFHNTTDGKETTVEYRFDSA